MSICTYHETLPILLSSETSNGATNVSADGSEFSVVFSDQLYVPERALGCRLSVESAKIRYATHNVTGEDRKLRFWVTAVEYTITLDEGLYSLSDVDEGVSLGLVAAGLDENLISFSANEASNRVEMTLAVADIEVDIDTSANSLVATILGFDPLVTAGLRTSTGVNQTFTAENAPSFDALTGYQLHCDLVHLGIRVNQGYSQCIASIPITVGPHELVVYQPANPTVMEAKHMIGQRITQLRVWCTDQNNATINMQGFPIELILKIEWTMAHQQHFY